MSDDYLTDEEKARKASEFIIHSDHMARSRNKNYDQITAPVIESARSDEKLAKEILSAPDPAQYAYDLGRKEKDGDLDAILADDSKRPKGIDQW